MNEQIELNIQPKAGILGVFSRLNYKAWYAIAEFVDNSTASYYTNRDIFREHLNEKLRIDIDYDPDLNVLTIKDNAFGMELEDFKRAIILDSKPENQEGRNEFGMGLKTAASWFGNIWSVESSEYGSRNKYFSEINIQKLREENLNSVKIIQTETNPDAHFTKITISDVTKKISSPRTKAKITSLLSSMYRRDINSGDIEIYFNGLVLSFDAYEPLCFRDKLWEREVWLTFMFDDELYEVRGKVGILKNGGFGKAGFALFRRNRVIIGGEDENYKPVEIFGQSQSTISHKLYGEFDLNGFPVNQAKDGFVWDNGLEEAFIDSLKSSIKDYIDVAKLTVKDRVKEEEFSPETALDIQDNVKSALKVLEEPIEYKQEEEICEQSEVPLQPNYQEEKVLSESDRSYCVKTETVSIQLTVSWVIAANKFWIKYDKNCNSIIINIDHPFFKPFSENNDFKIILEKFVIAYYLAELDSEMMSNEKGYILPTIMKNNMNKYLGLLSRYEE